MNDALTALITAATNQPAGTDIQREINAAIAERDTLLEQLARAQSDRARLRNTVKDLDAKLRRVAESLIDATTVLAQVGNEVERTVDAFPAQPPIVITPDPILLDLDVREPNFGGKA